MKKWSLLIPLTALLMAGCHSNSGQIDNNGSDTVGLLMNTDSNAAKNLMVDNATFQQQLRPYGRWTSHASYGNVWIPNEGKSFRPYCTHGRWVYSDAGWAWNSDYKWGWAPFHYGRWAYDDNDGWMWVPGSEWAPAWVTWGRSNGYYGWAPLAPGVSINVSIESGWAPPRHYWNFVPDREFGSERNYGQIINVYSDPTVINNISNNVTIINNYSPETNIYHRDNRGYGNNYNGNANVVYNAGPRASEVEKITHQRLTPVVLRESANTVERVSNRQMNVYSPAFNNHNQNNNRNMVHGNRPVNRQGNANQQSNPAPAMNNSAQQQNNHAVVANNRQQNNQHNFVPQGDNVNTGRQVMQRQDNHAAFKPGNQTPATNPNNRVNPPANTNNRVQPGTNPAYIAMRHGNPAAGSHPVTPSANSTNAPKPMPSQSPNVSHGRPNMSPANNNRPAINHSVPNRPATQPAAVRPQVHPQGNQVNRPAQFNRPQQQLQRQAPQQHQPANMGQRQAQQHTSPQQHQAPQQQHPQQHVAPQQQDKRKHG